jgi:hypothetical protein
MPLEIDDNGLEIMTFEESQDFVAGRLQARLGDAANVGSLSFLGQLKDVSAELFQLCQDALLALYGRIDPNGARGVWLDRAGAYIGSTRRGESFSTVEGLVTFVGAGAVSNGDLIRHVSQQTLWEAIGGPYNGTDEDVAATFRAVDAGAIAAIAGSTWEIVTTSDPAFTAFTNPTEDAVAGQLADSDPLYRQRQTIERYAQGKGPTSAISAIVSKVNTANGRVDAVRTYHNPAYQPTDSNGLPWKQTHVVVETTPNPPTAELEQDIFDALWKAGGAGCHYFGSITGTSTDLEGTEQPVAFDIVELIDLYIVITIETANSVDVDGPVVPKVPSQFAEIVYDAVYDAAQPDGRFRVTGRDARELDYHGVVAGLVAAGTISGVGTVAVQLSLTSKDGPYTAGIVPVGRLQKIEVDAVNIRIILDGVTEIA